LVDEGTARAFRRVYLEKYGARMKRCRIANVHDSLYCEYLHMPEDSKMGNAGLESLSVSSSTNRSSSSKNGMSDMGRKRERESEISAAGSTGAVEIDREAEAEAEAEVVDRAPEQVLVFGSFSSIIDNGEDEEQQNDDLSVQSQPTPVTDTKPLCAPSTFSWSKPTTTATTVMISLNDIMREEEKEVEVEVEVEEKKKKLEAEYLATTKSAVTSNNNIGRKPWSGSSRPVAASVLQDNRPCDNTKARTINPIMHVSTTTLPPPHSSETVAASLYQSVAATRPCFPGSKEDVSTLCTDTDGGEWRSVKKQAKKSEETTGPKDKKLACKDCKHVFVHTVDDQKFYARMNFSALPKSCQACREKKKIAERSRAGKSHGV